MIYADLARKYQWPESIYNKPGSTGNSHAGL